MALMMPQKMRSRASRTCENEISHDSAHGTAVKKYRSLILWFGLRAHK
jgi:hypothetical protein